MSVIAGRLVVPVLVSHEHRGPCPRSDELIPDRIRAMSAVGGLAAGVVEELSDHSRKECGKDKCRILAAGDRAPVAETLDAPAPATSVGV